MYFIVLWFLLFQIFIWINFEIELMIYKAKRGKITDLQAKIKNSLCYMFCTQNGKNPTFRVDLWSQKVMWLCNGMSRFFLSQTWCQNIPDFKEESHEAAQLKAQRFSVGGKICWGGSPPVTF